MIFRGSASETEQGCFLAEIPAARQESPRQNSWPEISSFFCRVEALTSFVHVKNQCSHLYFAQVNVTHVPQKPRACKRSHILVEFKNLPEARNRNWDLTQLLELEVQLQG